MGGFMVEAAEQSQGRIFTYEKPDLSLIPRKRKTVWLGTTKRLFATIQAHCEGGEVTLHSHTHMDGFWFALSGRVRFYSDHTTVFADIGPMEGVLIPRGEKYWFEAYGDEDLEIFQIECSDKEMSKEEARAERGILHPEPTKMSYFKASSASAPEPVWLTHTDRLFAAMEIVPAHSSPAHAKSHADFDSVYYLLQGELDAKTGSHEPVRITAGQGVLTPHGQALSLQATDQNAVVLQVFCANYPQRDLPAFKDQLAKAST
jgi:mannose-6-phosphate isomerase-like protein (cupin superfamily)